MMQLKLRFYLWLFLFGLPISMQAQSDSIHQLKTAEIVSEVRIIYHNQGLKTEQLDSTFYANSINFTAAEVLSRMSSVYIKSYGGSGLASTSFRGGSANHTAILWHGFNLQSPVTGMIDLSLIPAGLFNSLSLQYGGKSTAWGSGAIGGAIHLQNKSNFNEGSSIKLYTGRGSFNEKSVLAGVNFSNLKFINSTKFYHSSSLNNFSYDALISDSMQSEKLPNAYAEQNTLMQENYFKITDKQIIETHIWLQQNKRQIPPTLYQVNSDAFQEDQAMRFTASYMRYFNKWNFSYRSAYFNEQLKYKDWEFSKVNENTSQTFINEGLVNKLWNRKLLTLGINNTFAKAHSIDFSELNPMQNKTALFSSFQYVNKKGNMVTDASLRQEWVNSTKVPLTWSIGIDYDTFKWIKFKANASRVYRIPTINDLFWKEGGNLDLLPESGYAFEGGLLFNLFHKNSKHKLTIELTAFSRKLDNWIIWLPNGGFWSPQNLMHVWSRGTETNTSFQYAANKIKFLSNIKTSYVLSENSLSNLQSDASLNKQLIYVPIYSGQVNWGATYKNATILLNHTYTGYRYTSSDHSQYLEPFYLHNLSLAYKLDFNKISVDLQFQINNILNASYQVLAARPMPGINYRAGILFNFKSNYGKS